MSNKITPYDVADYLDSDEMIVEYLNAAIEENGSAYFIKAVGAVARAKGMSELAEATGLGRQSLYKGLSGDIDTRISTVFKVLGQMGIQLRAVRSSESVA